MPVNGKRSDNSPDDPGRRRVLKAGAASLLGLALAEAADGETMPAPPRKRCIVLYMRGGPSHIDTWDPKPEAPVDIRGEFRAIDTSAAGVRICEHLPKMARLMHRVAVVRSVTSAETDHERARQVMLGGEVAYDVSAAAIPSGTCDPFGAADHQYYGHGAAWKPRPTVTSAPAIDPQRLRHAYGDTPIGRGCLRATEWVEAGTPFVLVTHGGWDTHGQNFEQLRERLLPELDAALSTLLRDLAARGLLEETLVVWMGDFGRTPKINAHAGRDHWPYAQSVLFAGAGVRGGQVIGATDRTGSEVVERPVRPEEIVATIRHVFGVQDPGTERGQVIGELF